MKTFIFIQFALVAVFLLAHLILASPEATRLSSKVFTYHGQMPIKEERAEAVVKDITNTSAPLVTPPSDLSEAEAACWKLIKEQSEVTFALQGRVLDELSKDMKNLTMNQDLRNAVEKIDIRMRENMKEALDALKRDSADEFFGALFDTSEDIISLSSFIRDPKLPDDVFLTLVKAVSRLGRNNSALIQEFTEMCSFIHRSPRPRTFTSLLNL